MYSVRLTCIVSLLGVLLACGSGNSNETKTVHRIQVDDRSVTVRVLRTRDARLQGITHLDQLPSDEGILFVYPRPLTDLFWSNRTLLKTVLDAAFIGPDGRIVRVETVSPENNGIVRSGQPAQFLLLMNEGWFRDREITPDAPVRIPAELVEGAEPVFSEESKKTLRIGEVSIKVRVARTPGERETGLMHRKGLPENHGMLFVYPKPEKVHFYMKNTLVPLDIAFIDQTGTIRSIRPLEPLNTTRVSSDAPVSYVLEMNRGWFQRQGITEGDRIPPSQLSGLKAK